MEKKEKQAIYYFLGWIITGILICFIGISNVFASTYNTNVELVQQYYDNRGSSLTNINTTWNESLQSYVSDNITTVANSYGAGVSLTSPIPLIKNHTYSISFYFIDRNNISLSIKNKVTVGTSLADAKVNYAKDTYYADTLYSKVTNNSILQFVFKAGQNGNSIFIPWTTTSNVTQSYVFTEIIMEDLGSEGISQEDINNSLNNQTNELNQSIQNSTDTITGEIDDMEQSIIDSNKETQEVIKDQFNTCRDSYNLIDTKDSLTLNGLNITRNQDHTFTLNGTRDTFISINVVKQVLLPAGTYNLSVLLNNSELQADIYYENNGEQVYLYKQKSDLTFTIDGDSTILSINPYFSAKIYNNEILSVQLVSGTSKKPYETYGEKICSNKIDETNDQLGNLNDSLNDSNIDGSLNNAGSFFDSFQSSDHGGLSGIITAPLVAINEMLNTTCNPMTATFKGKELSLPCGYDFWNKMGAIQDFLNVVLGGMLCYNIVKKLFKLIERIKNPEDDRIEVMDL